MRNHILLSLTCLYATICSAQYATRYQVNATYNPANQSLDASVEMWIANQTSAPIPEIALNFYADAMLNKASAFTRNEVDNGNLDLYFNDDTLSTAYHDMVISQDGAELRLERVYRTEEVGKVYLANPLAPGKSTTIRCQYSLYLPRKYTSHGYESDGTAYLDLWYPTLSTFADGAYLIVAYDGSAPVIGPVQTEVELSLPSGYTVLLAGAAAQTSESLADAIVYRAEVDQPLPLVITRREITSHSSSSARDTGYKMYVAAPEVNIDSLTGITSLMEGWLGDYPYSSLVIIEQLSKTAPIYREGLLTLSPDPDFADLPYMIARSHLDKALDPHSSDQMKSGLALLYRQRYLDRDRDRMSTIACADCSVYDELQYYYAATNPVSIDEDPRLYRHRGDATVNAAFRPFLFWSHLYHYTQDNWDDEVGRIISSSSRPTVQRWIDAMEAGSQQSQAWAAITLQGGEVDYGAAISDDHVIITKYGSAIAPMPLTVKVDQADSTFWIPAVQRDTMIRIPGVQSVSVDRYELTMDLDRDNNDASLGVNPSVTLYNLDPKARNEVSAFFGYNLTDRLMLGAEFASDESLPRKFQYQIAPMWSFGTNSLVGFADARYNFRLAGALFDRLTVGVRGKHFHMDWEDVERATSVFGPGRTDLVINNAFYKIEPYAILYFDAGRRTRALHIKATYLVEEDVEYFFSPVDGPVTVSPFELQGTFLRATYEDLGYAVLSDTDFRLEMEYGDYESAFRDQESYLKLSGDIVKTWVYNAQGSRFSLRLWGAGMLHNSASDRSANARNYKGVIALSQKPINDYLYDEHHIDRRSTAAVSTRQVNFRRGGGFTHPSVLPSNALSGQSQQFAFSVNAVLDLPFTGDASQVIQATCDFGGYSTLSLGGDSEIDYLYSLGLRLNYEDFSINIPVIYSDVFAAAYDGASFWRRLSFTLEYPMTQSWSRSYEAIKM